MSRDLANKNYLDSLEILQLIPAEETSRSWCGLNGWEHLKDLGTCACPVQLPHGFTVVKVIAGDICFWPAAFEIFCLRFVVLCTQSGQSKGRRETRGKKKWMYAGGSGTPPKAACFNEVPDLSWVFLDSLQHWLREEGDSRSDFGQGGLCNPACSKGLGTFKSNQEVSEISAWKQMRWMELAVKYSSKIKHKVQEFDSELLDCNPGR